jgi:POT family proton-dependent oligopeptide transporter
VIAFQMYFFAAFAFVAAAVFGWYATRYKMMDNYRNDNSDPVAVCYKK